MTPSRILRIYCRPAGKFCRLLAVVGMLVAVGAASTRAEVKAVSDWVPVSITAGEIYVISDIKPGTTPTFKVEDNPQAFVSYNSPPGKLTMLSAAAGRWIVTVTNTSDREISYDLNAFASAKAGAPLTPGAAPRSISDEGLGASSVGAGPSTSTPPATAAPRTFSLLPPSPSTASAYSVTIPDKAPPTADASWNVPPPPDGAPQGYRPVQSIAPPAPQAAEYRNDPSVLDERSGYMSDSVSGGKHYLPGEVVSLMTGTSEVIDFQRRITRISVADSKIADVQVIDPFQLNLIAHQPGFTTLAVWDSDGSYEERSVRIDASGRQQVMLNTVVAELDRTALENQGVNASLALTRLGISLAALPGAVATPYNAASTLTSSSSVGSLSGSSNPSGILPGGGSIIPLLLSPGLTYGLAAQNSNYMLQGFFQFLETHNLGKVLAEPHLLANSGEKAKFLSGGEIPIVIAQALNSTIVFKTFGTSVEFIPTVVGRDDIELIVKPEVSEPDYTHGVQLFGFTVPAFVTRRAETMARLKDGQTLIIAGLILHEKVSQIQKVPYLGDIPYLGGFFRNTSWSNKESDLVMSVTPQIVRPLPATGEVFLPTSRPDLTSEEIRTQRIEPPDAARPRF
jgi:Flp pilus assembly secretin CpaC